MAQLLEIDQSKYYGPLREEYRGYTFGVEKLDEVYGELRTLNEQHWEELDLGFGEADFDPDYGYLHAAEKAYRAVVFTIRRFDETLVGNAIFMMGPNPMVLGQNIATEQVFFIEKESRKGRLALNFVRFMKRFFTICHMDYVIMGDRSPKDGKNLAPLYGAAGFSPVSVDYICRLENDDGQ